MRYFFSSSPFTVCLLPFSSFFFHVYLFSPVHSLSIPLPTLPFAFLYTPIIRFRCIGSGSGFFRFFFPSLLHAYGGTVGVGRG